MRSKRSKNSTQNAPNAAQQRWEDVVRGLGPMGTYGRVEIHHFLGGTTQVKGIGNIGWWAIISISVEDHQIRHLKGRKAFEEAIGQTEKWIFGKVCNRIKDLPFGYDVFQAIMDYHR